MSYAFRKYLFEAFNTNPYLADRRDTPDITFQIDDQDDYDSITEFVNVFVVVTGKNSFVLEIVGSFPVDAGLSDLLEIYRGSYDPLDHRLLLPLSLKQLPVITSLCTHFRETLSGSDEVWRRHSARTVSSLTRFVRIMHGFHG